MDIKQLQQLIISNPLFKKLQDIIEYYPGYHDHETTFDHLLRTAKIAEENVDGHFITNPEAKEKFLSWANQEIHETTRHKIMILTALLHDCGKLLLYKEGNQTKPLRIEHEDGFTPMPGHPFWGGKIVVPEILKEITLTDGAKKMIASVVKVHDAYADAYFPDKKDWTLDAVISNVKSGATGYYGESLFNQYCDCYTTPPFTYGRLMIEKIFNEPTFYDTRTYILP